MQGLEAKVAAQSSSSRNGTGDRQILHGVNLTVKAGEARLPCTHAASGRPGAETKSAGACHHGHQRVRQVHAGQVLGGPPRL